MSPVLVAMAPLPGDPMSGTKALHPSVCMDPAEKPKSVSVVAEDEGLW